VLQNAYGTCVYQKVKPTAQFISVFHYLAAATAAAAARL
jgi:hypothetical protein